MRASVGRFYTREQTCVCSRCAWVREVRATHPRHAQNMCYHTFTRPPGSQAMQLQHEQLLQQPAAAARWLRTPPRAPPPLLLLPTRTTRCPQLLGCMAAAAAACLAACTAAASKCPAPGHLAPRRASQPQQHPGTCRGTAAGWGEVVGWLLAVLLAMVTKGSGRCGALKHCYGATSPF